MISRSVYVSFIFRFQNLCLFNNIVANSNYIHHVAAANEKEMFLSLLPHKECSEEGYLEQERNDERRPPFCI